MYSSQTTAVWEARRDSDAQIISLRKIIVIFLVDVDMPNVKLQACQDFPYAPISDPRERLMHHLTLESVNFQPFGFIFLTPDEVCYVQAAFFDVHERRVVVVGQVLSQRLIFDRID